MAATSDDDPCPPWSDDAHEHTEDHQEHAEAVARTACGDLRQRHANRYLFEAWHDDMFRGVVPLDYYAGNIRQIDPERPCLDVLIGVGSVPGSPPAEVEGHIQSLCRVLKQDVRNVERCWQKWADDRRLKELAELLAKAVGAFIQIHPFVNGNGRMSRVLWQALLARFGFPPQARVIPRPDQPYGVIMGASMRGNYAPLVMWILQMFAAGS